MSLVEGQRMEDQSRESFSPILSVVTVFREDPRKKRLIL